jgi:hypothetical protein
MLIPPTAGASALGVLGVAISLGMIGDALEQMSKLSWGNIGSSLTAMLGALTIIAAALYVIPPTAPLAAAGILIVAYSLGLIANALQDMATMSWEEIGKAMVVLVGSLASIAGAMLLMTGALPGAAALLVVTASLKLLAPVLMAFGQMSWEEIAKGLTMLAGVFVVLGVAGVVLAPLTVVLLALGAAITLLGIGVLAAGAGVLLFAAGLTALSVAGAAGAAALVTIVTAMIGLLPMVAKQIGLAVVAFAQVIAQAGPAITKAITTVLMALITAIGIITPKIVQTLAKLMLMMLTTLAKYVPSMVTAGLTLLTGILNGIAKKLPGVITAATNVIVAFLNGISKNLPRIIDSGVKLIISFINGVTKAIDAHSAELGAAGGRLAAAIIKGMAKGILSGIGEIASAAKSVASSALDSAKSLLGIHSPSKEFEKIGKYVNDGFRKGLDGNKAQVVSAMKTLAAQLKAAMADSAKDADTLEAKLKKLTNARSKDYSAIKKTKAALAQANKEHKAEVAAYAQVTKALASKSTALGKLADQQDAITAKLKSAQDNLANLVKTRADFKTQITDQYDNLPDITPETNVADYEADLKTQIEKTKEFSNTLQRLRALGLNDEAYKQLLAKGLDALPFADNLLAGGKDAVNEVNNLDKQLAEASKALGTQASSQLYDAAVKAAEGLVKGLQMQQAKIEHQMDVIADAMVKAIKKKLGIKSPSRAFMAIGRFSAEGVVEGLDQMSGVVEKSASNMGTTATESLRKALSNVADMVVSDIDVNPTITPVLDLSSVKKGAGQLGTMLPSQAISIDSAYAKARYVASSYASNQAAAEETGSAASVTPVTYNQYNNSPKALSSAEIYRQTNNQLSRTKGGLSTS